MKVEKESLYQALDDATLSLLELARKTCWNSISNNCGYIFSEIDAFQESGNYLNFIKIKNEENKSKSPIDLKEATNKMQEDYSNLYDINLFIWKAKKNETIIDIRYFLKSALEGNYRDTVINNDPMLHCKIAIPLYRKSDAEKFDVNWELGGIRHRWNLFCHKMFRSI